MPAFTIDVFHLRGTYMFKRFFDASDVFQDLKPFYNGSDYRFEAETEQELEQIETILTDHGFELNLVDDIEPFCVVKPRDEKYADILRDAVMHIQRGDHNVFVMRDQATAEEAELHGATSIKETEVSVPK